MADVNEFGPLESADESAVLKARVTQLETRESQLLEELKKNEAEFGQKRAMFMDLFKQKESELKTDQEKRKELEDKLSEAQTELRDIKMAVSVSEANKEEEIAKIRRQCQQEIETMQALMREAAEEASSSTALQYESERVKLQKLNENYEEEIQSIRSKLSQERQSEKGKSFLSSMADIVTRGTASLGVGSSEAENLEESMRKAQHDAEILKSVVLPLENEITVLKEKIKRQQDVIKKFEKQLQDQVPPVQDHSKTSLPSLDDVKDPEEKIQQLMHYLKTEKAARMDLEMYVAVLSTQKNTAQDETDSIRAELKEVCNILEDEKRSHDQLKQTWQMANDQFLESQRLMMMDMRRMENLLSAEQQRMLAEQQQKDLEREAQEKKVKELEEMRQKQAQEQEMQKSIEAVKKVEETTKKLKKKDTSLHEKLLRDKSESNTSVNSCGSGDFSFDDSSLLETGLKKSHSDLEISSISEQEFLDSSVADPETRSLQDSESVTSIRISPEKVINLPSLTEAQYRAITDHTAENEARKHLLASAKSKTDVLSMEGRRLVSDKEWLLLQDELKTAREKLGRPCDMCNNYEAQLQGVQDELKGEQAKLRSLDRELKAEKQTIESQKKYIIDLEENLKDAAENANTEISSLVNKTKECEKYLSELSQQHNSSQMEIQDQMKRLTSSQETAQKELTRLQNENDDLQGKHSKHAEQLQNEDINLPNNLEEMQLLLLKYREEIIAAKVAKEHTEEKLKSELIFLKDQVVSEQQEKNTMEEALTQEINSLQERLAIQDSLKSELDRESSVRAESETKMREIEQELKGQQAKSRQIKNALQKEIEEQSAARTKLEEETHKMRLKIQSLQGDLDNSEAVQRDFVKLSQSLQIQLEQIRQAETEVRWENEEDIDDCHSCKQPFTVTKRKSDRRKAENDHNRFIKHHCRHCGKIFCTDCITKTVNSGPKLRPAKVCDVCHTILVKDATPYFSTEPPSTPD